MRGTGILPVLSFAVALMPVTRLTAAGSSDLKPSLCFVTEWCNGEQEDVPLVAELRQAGFLVDNMGIQDLTPEKMQRYNALIFPEFPRVDPLRKDSLAWEVAPDLLPAFNPAVDAYVRNGGGVVVYGVCFFHTQRRGMEAMNRMMEPWGVATLFEQVWDPERQFHYKRLFALEYGWTANLAKHPLTEGLQRIFYPMDDYFGPTTCSFKLSGDWTVIARGEAGARSVPANPVDGAAPRLLMDKPGAYDSAPPIVAIREYGKGRLAVIGVSPVLAVFGARFAGYENVLLDAGDGNLASDYGQLQQRLYRWVAEPAAKAGAPGGYVELPRPAALRDDIQAPVIDWATFDAGAPGAPPFRGLIGARTKNGGGGGTVAEYVAAAEQAGLRFIVFAEDFDRLDAARWEAFRQDCRSATTTNVLAVPGFLYRDNVNARWLAAGDFPYPPPDKLSADGRRIIGPTWWFDADTPLNAPIDVGHNPRPFWTYSLYGAMAVKTFEDGRLIDDATAAYLDRQEIGDWLAPIVVDLLRSPASVAASSTHHTDVWAADQAGLRLTFARNAGGCERFCAGTGPAIVDWRVFNSGRCPQGRWEPLPGTERVVVHFQVAAANGIRGVRLLDGPHVLRRFDGGGAKEFAQTVHLLHDRQRHFMVEAEDTAGNRTITGPHSTCDQLNVRRMCSDRGNTIDFSVLRTPGGRVFINGPVAPYQRKSTLFGFSPGFCDLPSTFAAPYVDGGLRSIPSSSNPEVLVKGEKNPEGTFASRMVHPMSSRDVIIQQSDLAGWYTNQFASAWNPAEPVEAPRLFTARVRWLDFAKRYHDPGFTLVEGTLTFLRDAELDRDYALNPLLHRMQNASTDMNTPAFSIEGAGPGGRLAGMTAEANAPVVEGPFAEGGFAALLPSLWGSGAVLVLDPGYAIRANLSRPTAAVQVGLPMGGRKVTAGQEIRYRLLVGRGVLGAEPSDREWREFRAAMGLVGPPAYAPTATQGRILSTQYVLEGEATNGGFAVRIARAALPVRLPIGVHPVNPKWTAVIANVADGSFLPVGVIETERKAYATWDASPADAEIYVGNIVTTDAPELILTAVCAGKEWIVDVHNPTEQAVAATVKGAPKFTPLAGLDRKVEVPPGRSIVLTL